MVTKSIAAVTIFIAISFRNGWALTTDAS
jgi:hypothetical protein